MFPIITWSRGYHFVLEALPEMEKAGINPEIVDLRTVRPIDEKTMYESVRKTNRVLIVEEGWPQASVGSHVSDLVQRNCFDYLDAPILRVHQEDVPMPYASNLEKASLPSTAKIMAAVQQLLK